MRSISFTRLRAEHFKVYQDVTVEFAKFGPGCHSIRGVNKVTPRLGSNGAGKSTLWDALLFALYGRTAKKLRSLDVVPYGSKKNPTVTLDFTIDGQPYRIIRRAWPHALVLHTGHLTDDAALTTSPQERINQLIGMDMDMFMHTVILAQGAPLFLDLQPRDKLTLLSDVLNLTRFEMYAVAAKNKVQSIRQEDHTLAIARSSVEGQLVEVDRQIGDNTRLADDYDKAAAAALDKMKALRSKAERSLAKAEAAAMAAKLDHDAAQLEAQDAYREMAKAEAQHNSGKQLRMRVGRMTVGSDCPQCGQPVTKEAHQHLVQEAESLIEGSDYARLKQRHERVAATASVAARDWNTALDAERRASADAQAAIAAVELASPKSNPHREQGSILKQRRHHLETRAKEIDCRRDRLEAERQTLEPWIDGFRDIRLMVLDDVLATMSVLTTSYANELGLPCDVKFAIDRTTKSGTTVSGISMSVDAVEKIEAWSGGEAQRLRLAASLALSASLLVEAGISFDLLALDEPSAHLSAEGLDELTAFLATHAEAEGRRIFMTDQRNLSVDSTVTLTRAGNNVSLA